MGFAAISSNKNFMGKYLTLSAKESQKRTKEQIREELIALELQSLYSIKASRGLNEDDPVLPTDQDEFSIPYGMLQLTEDAVFNNGELATIRVSWAADIKVFDWLISLAEDLNVDLSDESGFINRVNKQKAIDDFRKASGFVSDLIG